MKAHGERIVIFGDSLSHPGSDDGPTQSLVTLGSNRFSSAPGDLMGSMLLEQGAEAVMIDARVGRSAWNYWKRENTAELMATIAEFRPTKAVVMLGTNDLGLSASAETQAFTAIRDTLKSFGAEVWAIGPMHYQPPASAYNAKSQATFDLMKSIFGGGYTLDARPLTLNAARSRDGVHFSTTGAREAAIALTQALIAKNPKAAWWGWGLGLVGVIGVAFLGYKFGSRGGGGMSGLELPPGPGEDARDWGPIINDALQEGDTERAQELLAELDDDDREKLRKLPGNAMWRVHNEKDWDAHDAVRDVLDTRMTEEAALQQLADDMDDYRENWIDQNAEDVIAEGGIPEIAWENFRESALYASRAEYKRQAGERQRQNDDEELDGPDLGARNRDDFSEDELTFGREYALKQRFQKILSSEEPGAVEAAQDFALENGLTLSEPRQTSGRLRLSPNDRAWDPTTAIDWNYDWTKYGHGQRTSYLDVVYNNEKILSKTIQIGTEDNDYARKSIVSYAWAAAKAINLLPKGASKEQVIAAVEAAIDQDTSEPSELWGKRQLEAPGAPARSLKEQHELFTQLIQENPPQFEIAEDMLKQDGTTLRKMMYDGPATLHYFLETKRAPLDRDYAKKEKKVSGSFTPVGDDRTQASAISFYVAHGPSRYAFEKKLDKPVPADDARKMIAATIWELTKRLSPFSLDVDEPTIQRIAEKTIKQRHNITKRYADIA